MTLFEFISVMVSIVLGLSIAQLFSGISQFARHPKEIRYYLPHTVWLVNLILLHFLMWWSFWDYRDIEWNYARFLVMVLEPLGVFLVTAIVLPRNFDDDVVDLKQHFGAVRRWFFVTFLLLEGLFIVDGPLVFHSEPLWMIYRIPQLVIVGVFVLSLLNPRDWAQHTSVWTVQALMLWSSVARFLPGTIQ